MNDIEKTHSEEKTVSIVSGPAATILELEMDYYGVEISNSSRASKHTFAIMPGCIEWKTITESTIVKGRDFGYKSFSVQPVLPFESILVASLSDMEKYMLIDYTIDVIYDVVTSWLIEYEPGCIQISHPTLRSEIWNLLISVIPQYCTNGEKLISIIQKFQNQTN